MDKIVIKINVRIFGCYRSVYKDSQPHIQAHLVLQTHKVDTKTKRA